MTYSSRDDELLLLLIDAPNRWVMRGGLEVACFSTLRQAVYKAKECLAKQKVACFIAKLPNDEVKIEAEQILRLHQHLEDHALFGASNTFSYYGQSSRA